MKKIHLILICVIIGCSIFSYNIFFNITNDKNDIKLRIENFISRSNNTTNKINSIQMIDIDNKKYVLFLTDTHLGSAELVKGFNGKYRIIYAEQGNNLFIYKVIKTNKSKYFIIFGKRYETSINYVRVILEGHSYTIHIPNNEYFIAFCTISNNIKTIFPNSKDFKLYDINDNDITYYIYKKFSK